METTRNSRAMSIVILGVLIVLIGRFFGLSLGLVLLLLALLLIVLWVFAYWRTWRTLEWFREYNRYSDRVRKGDADAVIAELEQRRARGDRSPETAITLAAAYNYLGRGQQAEPLALEAFEQVTAGEACETLTRLSPRAKCDLAHLTRYDSMLAQGRFVDAAGGLRERIMFAIQPNFLRALTAWAYFLGGAYDQTRTLLIEIEEPGKRLDNQRLLSRRFEIVVAYMRFKLEDMETLPILYEYREYIDEWEEAAERNAHNPYGKRLRAIVDDMRAQIEAHFPVDKDTV